MRYYPVASFNALAGYDKKHSMNEYCVFGERVIQSIDSKLGYYFTKEFPSINAVNVKIEFFVKKIIESINREPSNIFFVWLDNFITVDCDDKLEDVEGLDDKYIGLLDNVIDDIKENDDSDNNFKILVFEYCLIPKETPIFILDNKL